MSAYHRCALVICEQRERVAQQGSRFNNNWVTDSPQQVERGGGRGSAAQPIRWWLTRGDKNCNKSSQGYVAWIWSSTWPGGHSQVGGSCSDQLSVF